MARIGKSIRWYFICILLLLTTVGGSAMWFWMRSDELLKSQLTAQLEELLPDWNIQIGRTRYDWKSQIHIYDVTIQGDHTKRSLLQLPEVIVQIDVEQFKANQHIQVQKLILKRPSINLLRNAQGMWNWEQLSPPPRSEEPVPEIEVRDARYRVILENGGDRPPGEVYIEQANVRLIPTGRRNVSIEGLTHINQVGRLAIKGNWSVDTGEWDVSGSIAEVKTQGEFLSLIAGQSPELLTKLQNFDTFLNNYPAQQDEVIAQTAAVSNVSLSSTAVHTDEIPDFGVGVLFDLDFQVTKTSPTEEPDFKFKFDFKDGKLTNRILPFPLSDLKGTVVWDNDLITIEKLTAMNGPAGIQASGKVARQPEKASFDIDLKCRNITLDQKLRARLTPGLAKLYDDFHPAGVFDLDVEFYFQPGVGLKHRNLLAKVRNGSCRFVKFPYPFTAVEGTVQQPGDSDIMEVDIRGLAARRETAVVGWLKNPGREAESHFEIQVSNLPVDDALLSASPPPLRKTLDAMQLQGQLDVNVELNRPPGLDQKYHQIIDVQLHHGAIQYAHFPYPVNDMTGRLQYDNHEKVWYFQELLGRNGQTTLMAEGLYDASTEPGHLSLKIDAKGGWFDAQLKQALSPEIQTVWDQLSPRGRLDLIALVDWDKGTPPSIRLPKLNVSQGEMTMDCFPYPIKNIEGEFEYAHRQSDFVQNQVHPSIQIKSFHGQHDNTRVQMIGIIDWAEYLDAQDWRVHFAKLHVDDLIPDRMFRLALPPDLRNVVEELNPEGNPISLSGTLDLRGSTDPQLPVTAGWNVETVLSGSDVWAGVELDQVRGNVTSRGIFNGQNVEMTGEIDIESAELWGDYQLTNIQGPYFLVDRRLWVGSVPKPIRPVHFPIDKDKIRPVTAKAIGGTISLEGDSLIEEDTIYKLKIIMEGGLLEEYARLYLPGTHNLRGVINSWIELKGQGNNMSAIGGNGQILISPAALYELPVFLQMFNELGGLIPQDKTAFKTAFAEYDISQKQFRFNRIQLQGDSIGMYGQGTARFDGQLNLDFYSVVPRNNLPLPIVNEVVNLASRDFVGVKVRGNVNRPIVTFDNAIKRLFDSIPVRDAMRAPAMLVPPFSFSSQPMFTPTGRPAPGN
ncbi:hypothetical protein Pla110_26480 [Polystyrenella longa]|uniref:AsmA-like C-terminal domain-containing protein n=1 Tax=Polystyrenella longa TaxID=2528007 RepID=A0A518CNW5_9PLAN|nr:DUF3971 domain-containing protein [Polystyrenella longa]QDU80912.1 hypothetical protein Pla110_26480 [Polystyrenella longa]